MVGALGTMARLYPGAGAVGPAAAAAGRGDRGVAVTGLAGARSHEDPAEHPRSGAAGAGRAGGPTADWTTRRWLTAGACAALVVLAVLAATGVWVFARSTAISDRLVDGSTPALVASVRLESALVNQETGARGYGLTGEPGFLEPYRSGLRQQKDATAQLRTLLAGDRSTVADLDEVLARAETWQSRFGRPVATAPAGAPVALATERADEGRQDFNAIRVSTSHLEKDLEAARDRARTELHHVRSQRRESGLLALMEQVLVAERPYSAMFATVAMISLHPDACRIDVTLAGHDEPLLVQHGTARPLPSRPGVALGIGPGGGRHTTRTELPAAASLLLHTDGLVEGHSGPGHERLGTDGLLSIIDSAPRTTGRALVDHLTTVTRKLDAGRHLDDLAILLLSWDFTAPEGTGRTV